MTQGLPTGVLAQGTRFGQYQIVRRIAEGGMGVVYEAMHVDLEKRVALKVLRPEYAAIPTVVKRFALEARAASRLHHPHVIGVSDVGVSQGVAYMVIDFLVGEDLAVVLHRAGRFPSARLADVMLPVVSAVAAAHAERIVHRDLKPENIFLLAGKKREHPILLDFGISKVLAREGAAPVSQGRALTREDEIIGTPHYMAPEQALGVSDLDSRSDQYALGVILYQCVAGIHPFADDALDGMAAVIAAVMRADVPPPSSRVADVPRDIDMLIERCLRKHRDDRFESVRDIGRVLWPFASPIAQAVWAEEFGDPDEISTRISTPAAHRSASVPPPAFALAPVTPADLRTFEVFEGCSDEELGVLLREGRVRRYPVGAHVFEEGTHAHSCFLLMSGELRFVRTHGNAAWKKTGLSAGSLFGHIALIANVPRKATLEAATDCIVFEITREVFERKLNPVSLVAMRLREHAAIAGIRQLRRATKYLSSLAHARSEGHHDDAEAKRELAYVQIAAQEWSVPIPGLVGAGRHYAYFAPGMTPVARWTIHVVMASRVG